MEENTSFETTVKKKTTETKNLFFHAELKGEK